MLICVIVITFTRNMCPKARNNFTIHAFVGYIKNIIPTIIQIFNMLAERPSILLIDNVV